MNLSKELAIAIFFLTPLFGHAANTVESYPGSEQKVIYSTHIGKDIRDNKVYLILLTGAGNSDQECKIGVKDAEAHGHTLGSLQLLLSVSKKVRISCQKSSVNGSTILTIGDSLDVRN